MKLVTYRTGIDAAARLGVIVGEDVVDVARLAEAFGDVMPDTMLGLIDLGPAGLSALRDLLTEIEDVPAVGVATALANVTLLAPIPRPRKNVFCIGLNYVEHAREGARALETPLELPEQPVVFSKPSTTIIGPDQPIRHDASITQELDWEVELAVIIGTTATRVTREKAMDHVFGYSILIDVSSRDNRRAGQWLYSKGMDSYGPFGPCIVTADEIPDPQVLDLWLTVNGVQKQRSNTSDMIFPIDHLIADVSRGITLEPGDIMATGTPEGVGAGLVPQEWLWPGDVVVAGIDGIGTLRNPVVNATPDAV